MKNKRIVFLIICISIVSIIIISLMYRKGHKEYIDYNDMIISISDGNGGTLQNVPEPDEYEVTVDCTNADGSWDYNYWKLIVKNVTGNVSCDLTFTTISPSQSFAAYIIANSGTTQGDGKIVNERGYRYEGKNPNNYVWFNNELWRVIGVFGSNRHGVTDTNLVKIIRDAPIGQYAWNGVSSCTNKWNASTLYRMLNGCYYNALLSNDTTNISGSNVACSNYCITSYVSNSVVSPKCDFSVIGIQNDGEVGYRNMIKNVTWYLGGPAVSSPTDEFTTTQVYNLEVDSTAVYSGNPTSTSGYVGLMYLSDFGYSVQASSCSRSSNSLTGFNDFGSENCSGSSWLYKYKNEWTITPDSGHSDEIFDIAAGWADRHQGIFGFEVRPVVYLKTSVYKHTGDGSVNNPYILGKGYEYENTFNYSSSVQTVTISKAGYYKLEVYGAKGGNGYNSTDYLGGNGGYATGVVRLNANDILYVHTGGVGKGSTSKAVQSGGTNGGGAGGYNYGGSGGGATDIRINTDSLYARVIVGGGGGGGAYYSGYTGGAGGGTTGGNGTGYSTTYNAKGGGTTSGGAGGSYNGGNYKGTDGSFGNGGAAATSTTNNYGRSGGGGGGWYGGGGGGYRASSSYYRYGQSGGGGGSSYTYSSSTASQVPSGYLLNADYQMTSTSTTAGSNTGDGYAKVTYCGQLASDCS